MLRSENAILQFGLIHNLLSYDCHGAFEVIFYQRFLRLIYPFLRPNRIHTITYKTELVFES
jgi:hypothetical protein